MKRVMAAALAATIFASAAPAYATDTDYILLQNEFEAGGATAKTNPFYANFHIEGVGPGQISAGLLGQPGVGAFTDHFYFALLGSAVSTGEVKSNLLSNITFNAGPDTTTGLSIIGYALDADTVAALQAAFVSSDYTTDPDGAGPQLSYLANVQAQAIAANAIPGLYTEGTITGPRSRELSVGLLANVLYKITVSGNSPSTASIYTGSFTTASVPEPATWAMMLAGFGFIGFAMRRQRKVHPKVRFAF